MIDWIYSLYSNTLESVKEFPELKAYIATGFVGGITVVGGWVLWKGPLRIWNAIVRQCTTTIYVYSSTSNSAWTDNDQYDSLLVWISGTWWFKVFSRSIQAEYKNGKNQVIPGIGRHLFWFNGRMFMGRLEEMPSQGTKEQKYRMAVTMLGRNRSKLVSFTDQFKMKTDETGRTYIYTNVQDHWMYVTDVPLRPFSTIALDSDKRDEIVRHLDIFKNSKQEFSHVGLPYKKTFLLYGPPGTGKTSLAKAMAVHTDRNVYVLNLNNIQGDIGRLLARASGGLVLIEDIDTFSFSKEREMSSEGTYNDILKGITLSEFLNGLDGVAPLHDIIIAITTNHLEKLDAALIRKGRVDHLIEISLVDDTAIKDYLHTLFPDYKIPKDVTFPPIHGALLNSALQYNLNDPDGIIKHLLNPPE